jgi:hypothetical protein
VQQPLFDYFRGEKGPWTRQVAMVKDADAMGPNYYVLRDTVSPAEPATWRLWLTASKVTVEGDVVRVEGSEDVDLDLFFFGASPPTVNLEQKTRTSSSSFFNKPVQTAQTGLVLNLDSDHPEIGLLLFPRLKSQKPPILTPIAGGRGVRVETEFGVDEVFMSDTDFVFRDNGQTFDGTVGSIIRRPGTGTVVCLGENGKIGAGDVTIASAACSTVH